MFHVRRFAAAVLILIVVLAVLVLMGSVRSALWAPQTTPDVTHAGPTLEAVRSLASLVTTRVIPMKVDFSQPFGPSDQKAWKAEYDAKVHPIPFTVGSGLQSFTDWNDSALESLLEGYGQRGRGGKDGDGYDEF
jgi:hypothetical protein